MRSDRKKVTVLDPGVSREEVKSLLIEKQGFLESSQVATLPEFLAQRAGLPADRRASTHFQIRVLRELTKSEAVRASVGAEIFPALINRVWLKMALRKIKSLQIESRSVEERLIMLERLEERRGAPFMRERMWMKFLLAYESALVSYGLWDDEWVLCEWVRAPESWVPVLQNIEIHRVRSFFPEPSLVAEAWSVLASRVPSLVVFMHLASDRVEQLEEAPENSGDRLRLFVGETLASTSDQCLTYMLSQDDPTPVYVMMEDSPQIRDSLEQSYQGRGASFFSYRDPTLLRRSEAAKDLVNTLGMIRSRFHRDEVETWLAKRGFVSELSLVRSLRPLGSLSQFRRLFRESEFIHDWERWLVRSRTPSSVPRWVAWLLEWVKDPVVVRTLAKILTAWNDELKHWEESDRLVSFYEFTDEFLARFWESPPAPDLTTVNSHFFQYRLGTAPVRGASDGRVLFVCPDLSWLECFLPSDSFFSALDREILAVDFPLVSRSIAVTAARNYWRSLLKESREVLVQIPSQGPGLRKLEGAQQFLAECFDPWMDQEGIQNSRISSDSSECLLPLPLPRSEHWKGASPELSVSALDAWSRCPFRSYWQTELRVRDLPVRELDVSPRARGQFFHRAAELLAKAGFSLESVPLVVERAFQETQFPMDWSHSRLGRRFREEACFIMTEFLEDEWGYRKRTEAETIHIEAKVIPWKTDLGITVHGRPDRVDYWPGLGYIIIDYKTGEEVMTAQDILTTRGGIQFALYSRLLRESGLNPVFGVQAVSLTKSGGRSQGIFDSSMVGAKKFIVTRSKKSIVDSSESPNIWGPFDDLVDEVILSRKKGHVAARPRDPSECSSCSLRSGCGIMSR